MFSCEICEIFKSTFFYRKPPVAASVSPTQISTIFSSTFSEITVFSQILKQQISKYFANTDFCSFPRCKLEFFRTYFKKRLLQATKSHDSL